MFRRRKYGESRCALWSLGLVYSFAVSLAVVYLVAVYRFVVLCRGPGTGPPSARTLLERRGVRLDLVALQRRWGGGLLVEEALGGGGGEVLGMVVQ